MTAKAKRPEHDLPKASMTDDILAAHRSIFVAFAEIMESRDRLTRGHAERTSLYAEEIAQEMRREGRRPEELTEEFAAMLPAAAALHDIGKIAVPDSVLNKPGRLDVKETEIMRGHAAKGRQMILLVMKSEKRDDKLLLLAADIAYCHHERWDGGGYPRGIQKERIPLGARITAVADVLDALLSERPYKKAIPFEAACEYVGGESGKSFDPEVVSAFLAAKGRIKLRRSVASLFSKSEAFR